MELPSVEALAAALVELPSVEAVAAALVELPSVEALGLELAYLNLYWNLVSRTMALAALSVASLACGSGASCSHCVAQNCLAIH